MDRSEIIEIRKLFTYRAGDSAFGQFAGCFINADKEIKGKFSEKLLSRDKNTILKFCEIFKKTLANNNADITFSKEDKQDGGMQFLLEKIRGVELKEQGINDILFERFRDTLPENNYVVTAVCYAYDVPVKTKDKQKIDDASSELFRFMVCSVCPVKTTKGTLGYLPDRDMIGENTQQLVVDRPVFGFMYPSFNGRSTDTGNVLCFRTEAMDISEEFFEHKAPKLVKEVKKPPLKRSLVTEDNSGDTTESSSERITIGAPSTGAIPQYGSVHPEIPSLDTGTLSNDAHYISERTISDEDEKTPKSAGPSDAELIASSGRTYTASDKPKRKRSVSIKGDMSKVVKKVIDGVVYYLIPVDDADVE